MHAIPREGCRQASQHPLVPIVCCCVLLLRATARVSPSLKDKLLTVVWQWCTNMYMCMHIHSPNPVLLHNVVGVHGGCRIGSRGRSHRSDDEGGVRGGRRYGSRGRSRLRHTNGRVWRRSRRAPPHRTDDTQAERHRTEETQQRQQEQPEFHCVGSSGTPKPQTLNPNPPLRLRAPRHLMLKRLLVLRRFCVSRFKCNNMAFGTMLPNGPC
jgi:hypothetical protein